MHASRREDYLPAASLTNLQRRARLVAVVREFFHARGYWEVETPILSAEIISDAWLEPFVAGWLTDPQRWTDGGGPRFLQTSPEAHMKRLLAAGAEAIFQFSRVFRNCETGQRHNPEFTMLEWYRVGDDHRRQMDFVEDLVREAFTFTSAWRDDSSSIVSAEKFERLTYDEAFERFAGQRVLELPTAELLQIAVRHRLVPPESLRDNDRDGWLNYLLAELIEPWLGQARPAFLYDYPASQAALARVEPTGLSGPLVAQRFELYVKGVELCNGYHELTEAGTLEARTAEQAKLRVAAGLRPLPSPNRLLMAMRAGLPVSSGVALGFDRLVMLALGVETIQDVIAFPFDRA